MTTVREAVPVSLGKLNEAQTLAHQAKIDRMVSSIVQQEKALDNTRKSIVAQVTSLVGLTLSKSPTTTEEELRLTIAGVCHLDQVSDEARVAVEDARSNAVAKLPVTLLDSFNSRLDAILDAERSVRHSVLDVAKSKADLLALEAPAAIELELPTA